MGGDLQSPPMASTRIATALVGVLIAAAAVAFLRAEHLKLERSPVAKPSIQKFFSATCMAGTRHCSPSHRAALSFTIQPAPCAADFDGSGQPTVGDIFAMLTAWFSHDPRADTNHNGVYEIGDIFGFLAVWFLGCP